VRGRSSRGRSKKSAVKKVPNLPRIRALLALRKLGKQLSSDVIADGKIAAKFSIPTHRPANLGVGIAVHQEVLLTAFRQYLAGKRISSITDEDGKFLKIKISIAENGTAQIVVSGKGFAFAYVGLLTTDREARRALLERFLSERSVASLYADELRALVSARPLTDDDFLLAVSILSSSPESFVQSIRSKVAVRDLSNADLLPEDERHWDNLIAPWRNSNSLESFLTNEADAERARAFADNPLRAFLAGSLSYCAPAMVPMQRFEGLSLDELLEIVERASSLPDHFAVTGAFEICANRLGTDPRFEPAGSKLLERLLGDLDLLSSRCAFFAGVFVLTLARLAQHQKLKEKPSSWRRVTAAANASLVLRACGADDAEALFKWAVEHAGKPFILSTLLEEFSEPRWKPDWLTVKHLVADAFGRVEAALNKIPEKSRPADWVVQVEEARKWITAEHCELLCILPAIGESSRRKQPSLEETYGFRKSFEKLRDEPTIEALTNCAAGIYTVGAPAEISSACHGVIAHLQETGARWSVDDTQFALRLLSFVSVLFQDETLADSVAQFAIEKVRELPDTESTLEIVCRLVECSSAYADRNKAVEVLGRRLESVSFLAKPKAAFDLYDTLTCLKSLDPLLSESLGRALAAARLPKAA